MTSIDALLASVATWARGRPDVIGVALVGSHATGRAGPASDVDLVLVVERVEPYLADDAWLDAFGRVLSIENEDYGLVQSRRARYEGELEIEWGLADRRWVCTTPLDAPTAKVVSGGMRIVYDPRALIAALGRAARP